MKVPFWVPPAEMSKFEERLVKRMKARHLFEFLRKHRHELFDEAFQSELAAMYADSPRGRVPHPPAFLAMVMLLQGYTGVSDADAVEEAQWDMRWRMVLGLGAVSEDGDPPFAQGVLPGFRVRMMKHDLDRRLLERTVELAKANGEFGYKNLRLALDSSPLFIASRVEDTFNLLGHATRKTLFAAATVLGRPMEDIAALAEEAGIPLLAADPGVSGGSLKARLDVAWEKPEERARALSRLIREVEALQVWLSDRSILAVEPVAAAWAVVERILGQDIEPDPQDGSPRIKHGVAPERRPSIEDDEARHGRKSHSQRFVGYKRHIAIDLDRKLILVVAIAAANKAEAAITSAVTADLEHLLDAAPGRVADHIASFHIDRAYLSSALTREVREAGGAVLCRPLSPASVGGRFSKTAFRLRLDGEDGGGTITCPAGGAVPAIPGQTARFPARRCQVCPQRAACTTAKGGRSVSIHPDEAFFQQLRDRQATPEGRAELRQRTAVEHALSRQVGVQGRKARYKGTRKNLFASRVGATVVNMFALHREERTREAARTLALAV